MSSRHAFRPTAAAAATHTGGSPRGAYRYRGTPQADPAAARIGEIRDLLEQQRRMISLRSSRLRALFSELNERVAQAVCDGVKVTTIARAAGVPVTAVRGIGLGRDGLYPSGLPAEDQLRTIAGIADEVSAVEAARAAVERHRVQVLADARKQRLLDDYQLASVSGLKHDEIRKMTRGVNTRPEG
ncbi:hypothetical protein QE394_001496 [Arthrobacter sp. SORGH_AS 212]|uniref:hypothetical protein n=1 Tax=Pseudarthrobacter TaxID=1742993 RepID=UPI0021C10ABD|nr:hypothetical protein [Pseudarthrobacter equi]MCT9623621.1 hypothetical protein [Pseudarthrobacter equi]MDQ1053568.1 hypothetical protein [Arthrobacter sp. SORGH_AS_0212]